MLGDVWGITMAQPRKTCPVCGRDIVGYSFDSHLMSCKRLNPDRIQKLIDRGLGQKQIARKLGVSVNNLRRRMNDFGLRTNVALAPKNGVRSNPLAPAYGRNHSCSRTGCEFYDECCTRLTWGPWAWVLCERPDEWQIRMAREAGRLEIVP